MEPKFDVVHEYVICIINDLMTGHGLGFGDNPQCRIIAEWYKQYRTGFEELLAREFPDVHPEPEIVPSLPNDKEAQ